MPLVNLRPDGVSWTSKVFGLFVVSLTVGWNLASIVLSIDVDVIDKLFIVKQSRFVVVWIQQYGSIVAAAVALVMVMPLVMMATMRRGQASDSRIRIHTVGVP